MEDYRAKTTAALNKLTPLLKKVAEHALHHPVLFAQEPAAKVAQEIGVSETTIIRFSTSIGYSGFTNLQKEIRKSLYSNSPQDQVEFKSFKNNSVDSFIQTLMDRELKNVRSTMENINITDYEAAIKKICSSEKILVVGSYYSFSMAHWLSYNLGIFTNNVHLFHPGTDNIDFQLKQLGQNSLLIACSFHRYALDTLWVAEEAKKKGVLTISVTDSPIAPIIKFSDLYFLVDVYSENTFESSPVAAYSIFHALVTGVQQYLLKNETIKDNDDSSFRLKKFFV